LFLKVLDVGSDNNIFLMQKSAFKAKKLHSEIA